MIIKWILLYARLICNLKSFIYISHDWFDACRTLDAYGTINLTHFISLYTISPNSHLYGGREQSLASESVYIRAYPVGLTIARPVTNYVKVFNMNTDCAKSSYFIK